MLICLKRYCVLALLICFMLPVGSAFAADAILHAVDIQPVLGIAIDLVFAVVAAVGAFVVHIALQTLKRKANIEIDDSTREYLYTAMESGIDWAKKRAVDKGKKLGDPKIESELLLNAVNYVLKTVPDALKHFNITADKLQEMIEARLLKHTS